MSSPDGIYQDDFIEGLKKGLISIQHDWNLSDQTDWSLLCISENATFRADDPARDNPLVARVHRPGYHSSEEIISELNWLQALGDEQIVSIPSPLETRQGQLLTSFEHQGEMRDVVAFEFMPGVEPKESSNLKGWFLQLGEITAKLHQHTRSWELPKGFTRKVWNFETTLGDIAYWGDWRNSIGLDADGQQLLQKCSDLLYRRLEEIGEGSDCFGLIHADLRLANLLIDHEDLTVIDFDDCGFSWYLYDFAAAITFNETSPEVPLLQAAWVEGYRRVAALSQDEIDWMPTFIMLRRQLETAWVASHYETPTAQELGPQYTQDTLTLAATYLKNFG
jgi:Ser/Thr protein kinase RdoA (MazF antagonist)